MEEAMVENLGQQDVGTAAGDQLAIVAILVQPVQQGNLDTVHEFGGQHAFGGLLPVHLGDVNRLVVQKGTGHPFHAGGFQGIVHLLFDGSGKLFDDLDRAVVGDLFDVALGQGSQMEHDLQIHLHQLADPRPLNLDGHILTVFESGAVNLPDGCRGQGFRIQLVEKVVGRPAGFFIDDSADVSKGEGGNLVLQLGQLADEIHGHQVRAGREDLAHLDVGGSQLFNGHSNAHRPRKALHAFTTVTGDHLKPDFDVLIDLEQFDNIIETVFEEHRQDLPVAVQVSIGATDHTDFAYAYHSDRFKTFPLRPGC